MFRILLPAIIILFAACNIGDNTEYTVNPSVKDSVEAYTLRVPGGKLLLDFVVDDTTYFSRMGSGEAITLYSRSTRVNDTLRIGGHGADYFPAAVVVSLIKGDYFIQLLLSEKLNSKLDMSKPPLVDCTEEDLILSQKPEGNLQDTVSGIASFTTEPFTITDPQGREHIAKCKGRFYFKVQL